MFALAAVSGLFTGGPSAAALAPVGVVTLLAVLVTYVFAALVGKARNQHNVAAPSMTGPEEFNRIFRIHQNTVEQMVVFLPLLWTSALFFKPLYAALLGALFLIGRVVYYVGYKKEAAKRSAGFAIGFLANLGLLITAAIGIVRTI